LRSHKISLLGKVQSLSFRFFMFVFFYILIALAVSTALELFFGYRNGVERIETSVQFIRDSYVSAVATSLYSVDEAQLNLLLNGMLKLEGIVYCKVLEKSGAKKLEISKGNAQIAEGSGHEFPLIYQSSDGKDITIGKLTVYSDFSEAYSRLWALVSIHVASYSVMIFIAALLVMVLFQKIVARHLYRIADFAKQIDLTHLDSELKLDRRFKQDELEQVVRVLNSLQDRLRKGIADLKIAGEEKIKLESQLYQAQKMESIGNLAGGIAHDFNNILSSVIGFTELALDDVERGTPLENNLQEVYTAGKRARDLVKQILAFARQSDEERKPIQVGTIANEVLKLIRSSIPTTIEIKENIESHSLIMGNPSQVHQLFMNLCTNAAQAMEAAGGILEVGLTDVELNEKSALPLSELKSGNYMKVTVSDTGPGISSDIIDSIFEPYFTTKGAGEGTGMGLALVHGIVESYGGKITVDSELGKGTVFSIYLPITKKPEAYQQYEKQKLPSGTERILLVDDELPIAKMGSQILERLGYQVSVRTSSVEALELFRSKPDDFDLVITDMTMPNMTGDELAMELIAFRSDIPVILCTGFSKKITDEKAAKIGIKSFAYKPVVKADLAKTVRKVLNEAKDSSQQ